GCCDRRDAAAAPLLFDVHAPGSLEWRVRRGLEGLLLPQPVRRQIGDRDAAARGVDVTTFGFRGRDLGEEEFRFLLRAEAALLRLRLVGLAVADHVPLAGVG